MAWLYFSRRSAVALIAAPCWPPSFAALSRAEAMSFLRSSKRCLHAWQAAHAAGALPRENPGPGPIAALSFPSGSIERGDVEHARVDEVTLHLEHAPALRERLAGRPE